MSDELTRPQKDILLTLGRKFTQTLEQGKAQLVRSGIEPSQAHSMIVANALGHTVGFSSLELVYKALEIGEQHRKKLQGEEVEEDDDE